MRSTKKIILASQNQHKLAEFKSLLSVYGDYDLILASEIVRNTEKLSRVEQHPSYLENAQAKAQAIHQATHYPVLADDSGLEVELLGGAPGVKSHRYAPQIAGMSQDRANTEFLLNEVRKRLPSNTRLEEQKARFIATVVLNIEGVVLEGVGTLEGHLTSPPRGRNGFGYDPVFIPQGMEKTLAEMTDLEKNAISHRFKAIEALMSTFHAMGFSMAND